MTEAMRSFAWLLPVTGLLAATWVLLVRRPRFRAWLLTQLALLLGVAGMAAHGVLWIPFHGLLDSRIALTGMAKVLLARAALAGLLYLALLAVLLGGIVAAGYCAARAELKGARLRLLRAQLNPHFLFNALNAVAELCYRDAKAADHTITQMSELLRKSLANSRFHEIALRDELQFLERYLAIQQTLLQERLQVEYHIAPDTLAARIPSMILQPLVENAVIHGVNCGGSRILIRAARRGGLLAVSIEDDGPGLAPAALRYDKKGIGISNSRLRLAYLYGGRASLELNNNPGKGVSAHLSLP
ncbi:MAG: sensor histidine kinase, partial [Gammaproteobacteria bacterium]